MTQKSEDVIPQEPEPRHQSILDQEDQDTIRLNAFREAQGDADAHVNTLEHFANRALATNSSPRALAALAFEATLPNTLNSVRKRLGTLRKLAEHGGFVQEVREKAVAVLQARQEALIAQAPAPPASVVSRHMEEIDDILKAEGKANPWPWFTPRRRREFLDVRLETIEADVTGDLEQNFSKDYEFTWDNIGTIRSIYLTQDTQGKCDILNHLLTFPAMNREGYSHAASIIGEFLLRFIPNATWESFVSNHTHNACDSWCLDTLEWLRLKIKCNHEELSEEHLRLAISIAQRAQVTARESHGDSAAKEQVRRLADACEQGARNAIARRHHSTHTTSLASAAASKSPSAASPNLNEGMIASLDAGIQYGRYVLQEQIGSGAFGEVWKALDEKLQRTVALKFPTTPTRDSLNRLKREAQAAAKLEHEHIARIYNVEELGGRHFIAMQYVDGMTLDLYKPTSYQNLLKVMRDVAVALDFAHTHNVIHRDVKPGNILVTSAGSPYVTDFGLARTTESVSRLTSVGTFVGTWEYASPEQRDCKEVDARADVFSLGVTFHEVITGALPPGQSDKVSAVAKPYPPEVHGLEEIVLKCLAPLPEQRYKSAYELALSLEAILPLQERSLAPQQTVSPTTADNSLQVKAARQSKDEWGAAGYDLLLLGVPSAELDGAAIAFKVPHGFAVLRTAKPAGWFQDPSMSRPRTWLTPPDSPDEAIRIGRLCFHDLSTRLATPTGELGWSLRLPGRPKVDGTTTVDLEALLPLTSRPALGSSRRFSFEHCTSLGEVPFETGRRAPTPSLERDSHENKQVLRSPGNDDTPTYLLFNPVVPLAESPILRVLWKAKASKNLMVHLFFGTSEEPSVILTLKSSKAGDAADRRHSDREWVCSLGEAFGSDKWEPLELHLIDILQERFGHAAILNLSLVKLSFRGEYRIQSLEFLTSGVVPPFRPASPEQL